MIIQRAFSIKGVGKYLPDKVVSSSEIELDLGLPKNWINKYVGVKNRHFATKESNTSMGKLALRSALKDANIGIDKIDCLIGASATFDYIIPSRSSLIKNAFEDANKLDFPCIDINTVCTSFITALDYASLLFTSSNYQNIAIVTSEISSKGLNPKDPETYCLFGDGAAAIIVSRTNKNAGLIHYDAKTYSEGAKYTIIEGGGNMNHSKDFPFNPELYSFKMLGKKLLKQAKVILPRFLDVFFQKKSISLSNIDLIIPHQASKMGLKMFASLIKENSSKIVDELEDHGNCIAASIPLALVTSIESGRLKEGDLCVLLGTAAGISISGLLFKYTSL